MLPRLAPEDSCLDLLRSCHAKVRMFSTGLERIVAAHAANPADPQLPDAARTAARYFREALPKHAADEDLSITPRLLRVFPELGEVLATGEREHGVMKQELPLLNAVLDHLAAGEVIDADSFSAFSERVSRVTHLLRSHALVEETTWFPLLAQLPAEELVAIRQEMAERRA